MPILSVLAVLLAAPPHLPGRDVSLRRALDSASTIVIARLADRGEPDIGAPGQHYIGAARARVTRMIKGRVKGTITFAHTLQVVPDSIAETAPRVGEEYLLFLRTGRDGRHFAVKILLATPAQLAELDRARRSRP